MRKRRTRQHIIADLSVNFVERLVLKQGHVAERIVFDYGYDLTLRTFDDNGELEPGFALFQLKATDSPNLIDEGRAVTIPIDAGDLAVWLREPMPVFLILYDAHQELAYWVDVQAIIRDVPESGTATLRLPLSQQLSEETIDRFRRLKQAAVELA